MNKILGWIHGYLAIGVIVILAIVFLSIMFFIGDPKDFTNLVLNVVNPLFIFCVTVVLYVGPFFDYLKEKLNNKNTRKILIPLTKKTIYVAYLFPENLSGVIRAIIYNVVSFSQVIFWFIVVLFPAWLIVIDMFGIFGLERNIELPLIVLGIASVKIFLKLMQLFGNKKAKIRNVFKIWSLVMGVASILFVGGVFFQIWTESIPVHEALWTTLYNAYYIVWIITYVTLVINVQNALKLD
ncbi:hypothetical protein K8R43_02525 [archaeon]|nr:hypothetical protein [archaeon]